MHTSLTFKTSPMRTLPNILTIMRIFLTPVLVIVFYLPFKGNNIVAASIFALASITDWLDGYVARALGATSSFGAFLDPVADKIVVAVALILIVGEQPFAYITIPAAIIVGREIVISALREWMAEMGQRISMAVSRMGKLKTTIQMIAITTLLIYGHDGPTWIGILGLIGIYLASLLTIWSMFAYIKVAWPDLMDNR